MLKTFPDSSFETFFFQTNSPEETFTLGRLIALAVHFKQAKEDKDIFCVVVDGVRNSGKTTLLSGLANFFTKASKDSFCATQVGGATRVFEADFKDSFILSYDANTYQKKNPLKLLKTARSERGVLCVEHSHFVNLKQYGLEPRFYLRIARQNSLNYISPRKVSVSIKPDNVSHPSFQDFLTKAKVFSLD